MGTRPMPGGAVSGRTAYEAYLAWWEACGVYTRPWDELKPQHREAWAAAEEAIRNRYEYPEAEG